MNKRYTSLELSKKLFQGGCKIETNRTYEKLPGHKTWMPCTGKEKTPFLKWEIIYRYDILNDICVKYAKEFFGEGELTLRDVRLEVKEVRELVLFSAWDFRYKRKDYHTTKIFLLLQQNKKQEAEDYIWEHCLFNPKNK